MSRRIDIHVDRIVADAEAGIDRRALARAIGRELAARLRAPGAAEALVDRTAGAVDAGSVKGGDLAGEAGARIGAVAAGVRQR
jgi:hypothetical protein